MGFCGNAQSKSQRSFDPFIDGKGAGRRLEHQWDALGARPPVRLEFLCIRGCRSGLELSIGSGHLYRAIEDWHGIPDPGYRGTGGIVFVQPAPEPNAIAPAMLEGCRSAGIPVFENQNGRMMESARGASIADLRIRHGKRQSVFRSYVFPYMDRKNLTVLTHATVNRIVFDGKRASDVEIAHLGAVHRIAAGREIVLCCGTCHTPKILMQSGIGDQAELRRFGIPLVQHLPGVGANFQDHVAFGCIWESREALRPHNNRTEATFFCNSDSALDYPDLQVCLGEFPMPSPETAAEFSPPPEGWTLFGGLERPRSRGRIRLTGPHPSDPIEIETNFLSDPHDIKMAVACIEICREVGNSASMKQFAKREVMPGNLRGAELENFIRNAACTYWHQTGTAKMGRDEMSVVDGALKVHGIEGLRIADASVMPRITTGNTMPPASLSASAPDRCCDPSTNSRRLRRRYRQNDPGGGVRWMVTRCG